MRVYQLRYVPKGKYERDYATLFDIEYFQNRSDSGLWYSEINVTPIVEGITLFLNDKFRDSDFDYKQFIKEATEIQELRGLLYESYDNKPRVLTDANEFHCRVFLPHLKNILKMFAEKYNLWINED